MTTFTIELDETQVLAMSHVTTDLRDYIQNYATMRTNAAVEETVQLVVRQCLEQGLPVPQTRAEMVALAFSNGWVKTAQQLQEEAAMRVVQSVAAQE